MYFQAFFLSKITGKFSQVSCDSFEELQEETEKRMPKFMYYEAHNSQGLVGIAYKYLPAFGSQYKTYKKISA